jgi:hypothetical protein
MIELLLLLLFRIGVQHFYNDVSMDRATLFTSVIRGGEGRLLTTLTLDDDALGAPPIDFAHLYVLNLVTRLGVLDDLRHYSLFSLSQPANGPNKIRRHVL